MTDPELAKQMRARIADLRAKGDAAWESGDKTRGASYHDQAHMLSGQVCELEGQHALVRHDMMTFRCVRCGKNLDAQGKPIRFVHTGME